MTKFVASANAASLQTADQVGGGQIQQLQARITTAPDKFTNIDPTSTTTNFKISGNNSGLVSGDKLYVDQIGVVTEVVANTVTANEITAAWGDLSLYLCSEDNTIFAMSRTTKQLAYSQNDGVSWNYIGMVPTWTGTCFLTSVSKFGTKYYIGLCSTTAQLPALISTDLTSFTTVRTEAGSGGSCGVAVVSGLLVVGFSGNEASLNGGNVKIYSTTDAATFTIRSTTQDSPGLPENYITQATSNAGVAVFSCTSHSVHSSDGTTWTKIATLGKAGASTQYVWGAAYNGTDIIQINTGIGVYNTTIYKCTLAGVRTPLPAYPIGMYISAIAYRGAIFAFQEANISHVYSTANNGVSFPAYAGFCSTTASAIFRSQPIILSTGEMLVSIIGGGWNKTNIARTSAVNISLPINIGYSVTSTTPALTSVPTKVYKGGQRILTSAHTVANTPSFVAATTYSYTRNVDDIIIATDNRTALTANYAQIKVQAINKTDQVTKIEFIMVVMSAGQFNKGAGTYGAGSMTLAAGETGQFIPTAADGWMASKGA